MDPQLAVLTVAPALLFALIFGVVYLKSRENMALIERGINPKTNNSSKPFVNLKYGLLLTGAGLGLIIAYFIDTVVLKHGATFTDAHGYIQQQDDSSPAIYFALVAIGGGLGLVISYAMEKKHWHDSKKTLE